MYFCGVMKWIIFYIALTFLPGRVHSNDDPPPEYKTIHALGWEIKINSTFYEGDTSLLRKSFALFGQELTQINDILPKHSLEKLKKVTFWLEKETMSEATGEYHPSKRWLENHGGNVTKAGCIEVSVSKYYQFKSNDNEWVILHELTHAYHHRVIGFDNERVIRTYKIVKSSGRYRDVRHKLSSFAHGYALKNPAEYFAEVSTAYFGINNYYPHDRAELKNYDPLGYGLVEELWHVKDGVEIDSDSFDHESEPVPEIGDK